MGKHFTKNIAKKKNIIIIIGIVIVVGIIVTILIVNRNIEKNKEQENINTNIINTTNSNNDIKNQIENNVEQEKDTNITEETNNINIENKTESNEKSILNPHTTGEEENMSNGAMSNDEKAIKLAQDKWGKNDSSIYFTINQRSGSEYIISVRSNITTNTILIYTVNIDTNEVSEK